VVGEVLDGFGELLAGMRCRSRLIDVFPDVVDQMVNPADCVLDEALDSRFSLLSCRLKLNSHAEERLDDAIVKVSRNAFPALEGGKPPALSLSTSVRQHDRRMISESAHQLDGLRPELSSPRAAGHHQRTQDGAVGPQRCHDHPSDSQVATCRGERTLLNHNRLTHQILSAQGTLLRHAIAHVG
jgi:hypothetical protein